MDLLTVTKQSYKCKVLIIKETNWGVYENSQCYCLKYNYIFDYILYNIGNYILQVIIYITGNYNIGNYIYTGNYILPKIIIK